MLFLSNKNHIAGTGQKNSRILLAALALVVCAAGRQTIAYADTGTIQNQLSQTQQEVNKLFQLMDQSGIPDTQKQQLEIDIKKKIITDVIAVSEAQVDAVREEIQQAPFPKTADWQKVADGFNAILDADEHYYQTITDTLSTNPGITNDDIRSIASAMEERKTNIIDPDIKHIETVLATFNVKSILDIADARETKVGTDVDKIYSKNLTQNQSLKTAYQQASSLIADAHRANEEAQSITLNMYADQNDSSTQDFMKNLGKEIAQWEASSTPATDTSATSTPNTGTAPDASTTIQMPTTPQIRAYVESLVVQSLSDIQSAYAIFMQMSQNVKKYL